MIFLVSVFYIFTLYVLLFLCLLVVAVQSKVGSIEKTMGSALGAIEL